MATKYFNKYDKERMMVLALLISRIPDIVDNFNANLMSNKQRGRLKSAYTNMNNVFNEIIQDVDFQQRKQLKRAILHHDIRVVEGKPLSADEVDESNDTFLDLMGVVQSDKFYNCKVKDVEGCIYRIAMLQWSVPVTNEHCNDGECPYRLEMD